MNLRREIIPRRFELLLPLVNVDNPKAQCNLAHADLGVQADGKKAVELHHGFAERGIREICLPGVT
jgi:hypothetical protein